MRAGNLSALMFFRQMLIQAEAGAVFPPATSVEKLSQSFLQAEVAA